MLIVMTILLVTTALAIFAVHSTTVEIRSAGHSRQTMQTRYVAEGGLLAAASMLEQAGPEALMVTFEETEDGTSRVLGANEAATLAGRGLQRIELSEFVGAPGVIGSPIETQAGFESLGTSMGYAPDFVVDVTDMRVVPALPGMLPGYRVDGDSGFVFVAASYTGRGRTRPPYDVFSTRDTDVRTRRGIHETAMNSRANVLMGPARRR